MTTIIDLNYTGEPYSRVLHKGSYLIECWGAEGGSWDSEKYGGRGAYVSGVLLISKAIHLHFYVGQKGSTVTGREISILPPTFNGGDLVESHQNLAIHCILDLLVVVQVTYEQFTVNGMIHQASRVE